MILNNNSKTSDYCTNISYNDQHMLTQNWFDRYDHEKAMKSENVLQVWISIELFWSNLLFLERGKRSQLVQANRRT